jgi:hypothetical protein
MVAHVARSHMRYIFLLSWAEVRFEIACYVPGEQAPVWQLHAERRQRGKSDRELLVLALQDAFRWLKEHKDQMPGAKETR